VDKKSTPVPTLGYSWENPYYSKYFITAGDEHKNWSSDNNDVLW
jgi:hypothetical protein